MENIYYRKLKPPVQLVSPSWESNISGVCEMIMTNDMINNEVHEWLQDLGLSIERPRCLFKGAGRQGGLHIDCQTPVGNNFARLNWVFGGQGSKIEWFELLPGKTASKAINYVNEEINIYNENDCQQVCTSEINGLYVINTGIPHRVTSGLTDRFCYALFLNSKNGRVEWPEATEMLRDFIV